MLHAPSSSLGVAAIVSVRWIATHSVSRVRALSLVDSWPVDTVAVGVVRPDGVVSAHGSADQPFPLASVTKPLVAYGVLVAVEEGAVTLDDSAGPPGSTVRHLLAHASGLAPDQRRSVAPPATRRIYSNAGFELLADVVERATGIGFAEYLAEAVVQPLALAATRLVGSPAYGATSTVRDLLRFAVELLSPGLVHESTARAATAVTFPGLDGILPGFGLQRPNDWGLGFELRDAKSPHWTGSRSSPATFGHFGRSGAFFWVDPDVGAACACLTDREFGPWAARAWPHLTDAILAELAR